MNNKLHPKKRLFITIEGIEGVGKSTCLEFIKQFLATLPIAHVITREPGGTPMAEAIRRTLLEQYNEVVVPETELLLMFAARIQHVAEVVRPALQEDKWVICDRFTDATYAYQGGGRKISLEKIAFLEQWLIPNLKPDLTILLDAPVSLALKRANQRGAPDRFEKEKQQFFEQVRAVYLARAQQDPKRFHIIDATQPLDKVQTELIELLKSLTAASIP